MVQPGDWLNFWWPKSQNHYPERTAYRTDLLYQTELGLVVVSQPCSRSEEDFVTEEQLEVAKNGAVQQASTRGKADCLEISSATKSSSDRGLMTGFRASSLCAPCRVRLAVE